MAQPEAKRLKVLVKPTASLRMPQAAAVQVDAAAAEERCQPCSDDEDDGVSSDLSHSSPLSLIRSVQPLFTAGPRKVAGAECPYIDTVERTVLDFDFEKLCSVRLAIHSRLTRAHIGDRIHRELLCLPGVRQVLSRCRRARSGAAVSS